MKYTERIAKIDQTERKNAIKEILTELDLPYKICPYEGGENTVVSSDEGRDFGKKRLVVGAHWDSVENSTGANDNAASCSILLKLADKLRGGDDGLDFIFFDEEEHGWKGSAAYINQVGKENFAAMINLDVCGNGNNIAIYAKGNTENTHLCFLFRPEILKKFGVTLLDFLPTGDDCAFEAAGIPNITICMLNDHDLEIFKTLSQKVAQKQPFGKEEKAMFSQLEVMETMHHGKRDDISCVEQTAIDKLTAYLLECFA